MIFKCCKLIPVMVGSILIQKKKYGILDFTAATVMCLGLILFTLADSMISPRFDVIGVVMISGALVCDALIGNIQEKAMRQYKATNTEVVLYSYSIGFLYLLLILLSTGDITTAASFCTEVIIHKLFFICATLRNLYLFSASFRNLWIRSSLLAQRLSWYPNRSYSGPMLWSICSCDGYHLQKSCDNSY